VKSSKKKINSGAEYIDNKPDDFFGNTGVRHDSLYQNHEAIQGKLGDGADKNSVANMKKSSEPFEIKVGKAGSQMNTYR